MYIICDYEWLVFALTVGCRVSYGILVILSATNRGLLVITVKTTVIRCRIILARFREAPCRATRIRNNECGLFDG